MTLQFFHFPLLYLARIKIDLITQSTVIAQAIPTTPILNVMQKRKENAIRQTTVEKIDAAIVYFASPAAISPYGNENAGGPKIMSEKLCISTSVIIS